jgi:hypothetical protein
MAACHILMSTISCAAIELGIIAVMVRHSARMIAATLLIVACMFLPFLPGEYDGLAVTLSIMSQLFGMTGLLLVPLGAIWLGYELRMRAPKAGARPGRDTGHWFALASIGAATLVALIVAVGAFVTVGPSLGFGVIVLWAYCASRLAGMLKTRRNARSTRRPRVRVLPRWRAPGESRSDRPTMSGSG